MKTQNLVFVILLLSLGSCLNKESKSDAPPNILILLADDLGYGELGCYGQKIIETPVLDQLAGDGLRFTNFYAGNSVCSPSRAVLLTGIPSGFNTVRGNNGYVPEDDRFDRIALKKTDTTLGEMLRKSGYQTAYIGKWHLDDPNDVSTWAYNRGFDYAIQEQWSSPYEGIRYDPEMHWINGKQDSIYYQEKEWDCKDEFRTDLAIDYLKTIDKNKPFFLFMSYRAPHAHEYYINNKELYADRAWPDVERRHAAKITLLDKQIGCLLEELKEMGELDNTLVLFTSDNGPTGEGGHDYEFFDSNGELRGFKRDTYEGGIRVPTLAYWKGEIKPGTISDFIGSGQDFMATIADIAGFEAPQQSDGVSFVSVLKGENPEKREYLNWEFQRLENLNFDCRQAARIGNMKAVRYGKDSPTELYDLSIDISESNNIAFQYPELVKRMEKIFSEERTENEHYPYGGHIK